MLVEASEETLRLENALKELKSHFHSLKHINLEGRISDKEPLAIGSSCDVYKARLEKHSELVAVKCIRMYMLDYASSAKVILSFYVFSFSDNDLFECEGFVQGSTIVVQFSPPECTSIAGILFRGTQSASKFRFLVDGKWNYDRVYATSSNGRY